MISKAQSTKLVEIFFYVSDAYEKELKFSCDRYSNNRSPEFSDVEIMTIYLFCTDQEQRLKSSKFISLLMSIYVHGFQNCHLMRHSTTGSTVCLKPFGS